MGRSVHYKQGYRIIIDNKFYELSDGKRALYYGELRHRPTVQEVWNKTIALELQEERLDRQRAKANNKERSNTVYRGNHSFDSADSVYVE